MCRKTAFSVRFIVVVCAAAYVPPAYPQPTGYEGYQVVRITVTSDAEVDTLRALQVLGPDFQVWSEVIRVGPIEVRIAPAAKPALDASGLAYKITVEDLQQHIDDLYRGPRDGGFFDSVATYDEHVQFMTDLVTDHPDLAEMVSIGTTVEGRSLWALRITGPGEDKPGVMYHGAQHGNEQAGASLVAYVAHHLLTHYGSESEVATLVNNVEWFLLPIMNPDGYVRFDRHNANDIDLNRNWGGPGSGQDPNGGPYPFSEPETSAMRDFFLTHPNVRIYNDIHGYVPWIMWPWGHTSDLCLDHWTFHILGSEVHDLIEAAGGGDYDFGTVRSVAYYVSGGSTNYTYGELGIWAFTFELAHYVLPAICEEFLVSMLFLGKWISDCNDNGIPDANEIAAGTSSDRNGNDVPDECELPGYCAAPESEKLVGPDGNLGDGFGVSVALSETFAVVGVPYDDASVLDAGAAYVWRVSAPNRVGEDMLTASDAAEGDLFGHSVSVSGNAVLVGAPGDYFGSNGAGSAYVFRFDGSAWVQEAKLTASDGNDWDRFGDPVAVSGDPPQWAFVGAPRADVGGGSLGAVYVFRFDGSDWIEEAKLTAFGDALPGRGFGYAIGVSDGPPRRAIVGANRYVNYGQVSGAAWVFRFDGSDWIEDAQLTASDGDEWDDFGQSVALYENMALVGAPRDINPGVRGGGSAYVFRFDGSTWTEEAKFTTADAGEFTCFGWSLALFEETALIAAELDAELSGRRLDPGSAHVFRFNGEVWYETTKLTASDGTLEDHFGRSAAMSGDTLLVGAPSDAYDAPGIGAVYMFRGVSADCDDNLTADLCEIANGMSEDCNGNHVPDKCDAILPGDFTADGNADYADYAALIDSLAGPESPLDVPPECLNLYLGAFDADNDLDLDLGDFAAFQRQFTGMSRVPELPREAETMPRVSAANRGAATACLTNVRVPGTRPIPMDFACATSSSNKTGSTESSTNGIPGCD